MWSRSTGMTNYCPYCFGDSALVSRLEKERPKFSDKQKCEFHPTRKAIPEDFVVGILDRVIRDNYGLADYNPAFSQGTSLEDLIYDLISPDDPAIATRIIHDLVKNDAYDPRDGEQPFFAEDQNYSPYEGHYNPHHSAWQRFKHAITHERRFNSDEARGYLGSIFEGLHYQKDKAGQPVVYELQPGDGSPCIYRARREDNPERRAAILANPGEKLGAPPQGSRRANRMNAAGIPAFYGALDLRTCIAENRPPVGCVMIGAAFEIIRPIVVLDTTRFARPVLHRSIFSPVQRERQDQWQFMQRFMDEISAPVLPDDETLQYVATQVVSEFIHADLDVKIRGSSRRIEGIIYRSAQNPGGRNIVLFGSASETEHKRSTEKKPDETVSEFFDDWDFGPVSNTPSPALRVLDKEVTQVRVTAVAFETDDDIEDPNYLDNQDF